MICLIEYALWQCNDDRDISYIIPVLDELLVNKSEYEETWTVFGRCLSKMYSALENEGWVEKNVDKIFPERNKVKFSAAWTACIIASESAWSHGLLGLLRNKFKYALENKLCIKNKDYLECLGSYCTYYIAYNLDDEIIDLIFDIPELLKSVISFIGRYLNQREPIPEKVINKFKTLWERVKKLGNNDNILMEFQYWYAYGYRHFDREWAVNQLYDLIVVNKVKEDYTSFFITTGQTLLKDLPDFTRQVFEIVKGIAGVYIKKNMYFPSHDLDLIEQVVKYIKEREFENDKELKMEKDEFINKLCENDDTCELYDKLKKYLE
jgi:hypothetical protein